MPLITQKRSSDEDVSINLLPSDVKTKQSTEQRFRIAVIGAVGLLVILGIITVFIRMQIASAEGQLRDEQAKAADLRTQVAALREYEEMKTTIDGAKTILATMLQNDISWTRFLDDLDTHIPEDSWLTTVTVQAQPGETPLGDASLGTAQYTGSVKAMRGLANWLDTMSGIKGLQFVYLGQGSKGEDSDIVTFNASAYLTEAMLSQRCQGEGSQCP
jgi:Tfp pilus assembly protein PilN